MSEQSHTTRCASCGGPLKASEAGGLCPRCLMLGGMSLGSNTTGSARADTLEPPGIDELAPFFPGYEFRGLIGCGGMGAVYKALQSGLEREVAIKILFNEEDGNPEYSERFRREAQALAKLSHPNIIAVHDFGDVDDFFYIVMEFVDGTDLSALIDSQELQPGQSLSLVIQICQALQYAHDRGVVHRDIKPANILVTRDGRVKIADFGLAKMLGNRDDGFLTTKEERLGTPLYMAPEQRKATAEADHRADIYSLGVVFYEMLTGELPSGNFLPPSQRADVDKRVDEVVLKSMASEPARRYQHASEVQTRVEEIRGGKPRPRKVLLIPLAVAGLLVVGMIGAIMFTGGEEEPMVASVERSRRIVPLEPAADDQFGYAQHAEAGVVIVGAPQGVDRNTATGNGYVAVILNSGDRWEPAATLRDAEGAPGDRFGAALAASDRYLAVGAPNAGTSGEAGARTGMVFIYDRSNPDPTQWTLLQKLAPSDPISGQLFGSAIAIDGDRIVVGATRTRTGSVFIFEAAADGGSWRQAARLDSGELDSRGLFGWAVDTEGDRLVAGSPHETIDGLASRGAVYLYQRQVTGGWEMIRKLTGDGTAEDQRFGASVDLEGDRLAVGAYHDTIGSGNRQGSVSVFDRDSGGDWVLAKRVTLPESGTHTHFGFALDLEDEALLVGADWITHEGHRLGAAYLFEASRDRDAGGWGLASKVFHPEAEAHDGFFGYSVSLAGDTLFVGSPGATVGNVKSGAVYRCDRSLRGLEAYPIASAGGKFKASKPREPAAVETRLLGETDLIQQSDPAANDRAGHSVWAREDVVVFGAPQGIFSPHLFGNGFVSVIARDANGEWKERRRLTDPDGKFGDRFGYSVAGNDDCLLVAAPSRDADSPAGAEMGVVHVYDARKGTDPEDWRHLAVIAPPDPAGQFFGGAGLVLDGNLLAISAHRELESTGAVYLYEAGAEPGDWRFVKRITADDARPGELFAHGIDLKGDWLAVGAIDRGGGVKPGSALVFERNHGGPNNWGQVVEVYGNRSQRAQFGRVVAFDGSNHLVVGAPNEKAKNVAQGAVHIFERGNGSSGTQPWRPLGSLNVPGSPRSGNFGLWLQVEKDRLFVGSDRHTLAAGSRVGAVHQFVNDPGAQAGWRTEKTWIPPKNLPWAGFGWRFHAVGDSLAIGAPLHKNPERIAGGAYWIDSVE